MNENDSMTASEISEQIFKAIDAIVLHRLAELKFDRTVLATIKDSSQRDIGKYIVTTDNNISFEAFSDRVDLFDGLQVYIRIPEGDYTKRKTISGLYEPVQVQQKNNIQLSNIIEAEIKKFKLYRIEQELSLKDDYINNNITEEQYKQGLNNIELVYNMNKQRLYDQYGIAMPSFNNIKNESY